MLEADKAKRPRKSSVKAAGFESTLYRNSDICIPRNETARPHSHFLHSCICEQFIYSMISLPVWLQQNKQIDPMMNI
jgi:hypothetical protein